MMNHEHQWVPNIRLQRNECDYVVCGAAIDWNSKNDRNTGVYDAYPDDPDLIRKVDFILELALIGRLVKTARLSLGNNYRDTFDEDNFKAAISKMRAHIEILDNAIKHIKN